MQMPSWKKVCRKRELDIRYTSPNFVHFYDIDLIDFEELVNKLKQNIRLTEPENNRYGEYVLAMCMIVLERS